MDIAYCLRLLTYPVTSTGKSQIFLQKEILLGEDGWKSAKFELAGFGSRLNLDSASGTAGRGEW